jgi:hypothetical protein
MSPTPQHVPPSVWGPIYWQYLRFVLESCSETQAQTSLVPLITSFAATLPCESCTTNFAKVLAKYPPQNYVVKDRASRLEWYDLVRDEVRRHEPPKTLLYQLRKHRVEIMRIVGFVVFILLAGVVGALILRRCKETGVV